MPVLMFIGFAVLVVLGGISDAKKKQKQNDEINARSKYQKKTTVMSDDSFQRKTMREMKPTISTDMDAHRLNTLTSQFDNKGDRLTTIKSKFDSASDHKHGGGDAYEEVEPIVGSLGNVSDEGCKELDHIRFITPISYDGDDENVSFDMEKLATAMILGSALSEPKGFRKD